MASPAGFRPQGALNSDTFLTSIRDGGESAVAAAGVHEPESMGRVKNLHKRLTHVVSTLSEKVSAVLQKQEKEFLAAYRAHMYNVQKELQELRAKVDEAELAMKKNDKIRKLEEERDWYRKEALRLDTFTTAMKKDLKYMKEKLESIEDDRNWLERQLKSAKKQNKLLRAELQIRLNSQGSTGTLPLMPSASAGSLGGGSSPYGGGAGASPAGSRSMTPSEQRPMSLPPAAGASRRVSPRSHTSQGFRQQYPHQGNGGGGGGNSSPGTSPVAAGRSSRGGSRRKGGSRRAGTRGGGGGGTGAGMGGKGWGNATGGAGQNPGDEVQMKLRKTIKSLRAELETTRADVRGLRKEAVVSQAGRAELEEFFLKCVEDVKRDVARRRNKAIVASQRKRRGDSHRSGRTRRRPHMRGPLSPSQRDPSLVGVASIRMEDFQASDRRHVVQKLLAQDTVLSYLFDALFPPAGADPDANGIGNALRAAASASAAGRSGGGGGDASDGAPTRAQQLQQVMEQQESEAFQRWHGLPTDESGGGRGGGGGGGGADSVVSEDGEDAESDISSVLTPSLAGDDTASVRSELTSARSSGRPMSSSNGSAAAAAAAGLFPPSSARSRGSARSHPSVSSLERSVDEFAR